MIPFVMTDEVRERLAKLADLAASEDRILPLDVLQQCADGFDPEDPSTRLPSPFPQDQTIVLPLGWKVTMSYEMQPCGLARHLSISSPAAGRAPNPIAVQWVMDALGFVRPVKDCVVYPEMYADNWTAINVIEPVEPVQPGGQA